MAAIADAAIVVPAKASKGYWASVGSRLIKDKVAMVALTIILLIVLAAILAPYIAPADPFRGSMIRRLRPIGTLGNSRVTTIEGLSPTSEHPLQKAWIAEETPQCGYCQSGQIMRAAALLKDNPHPTREQIVAHMKTNICRCGSYRRIVAAIERAAKEG